MTVPATTGPIMFDTAGARPSQLNTRVISVPPPEARRPALRWIVIRPMLAPTPHSIAATASMANEAPRGAALNPSSAGHPEPGAEGVSHTATAASSAPTTASATASRIGRW